MNDHTKTYDALLEIGYTELEAFEEIVSRLAFSGTLYDIQELFLYHRIELTKNVQKEIEELEQAYKEFKQMEADKNERATTTI